MWSASSAAENLNLFLNRDLHMRYGVCLWSCLSRIKIQFPFHSCTLYLCICECSHLFLCMYLLFVCCVYAEPCCQRLRLPVPEVDDSCMESHSRVRPQYHIKCHSAPQWNTVSHQKCISQESYFSYLYPICMSLCLSSPIKHNLTALFITHRHGALWCSIIHTTDFKIKACFFYTCSHAPLFLLPFGMIFFFASPSYDHISLCLPASLSLSLMCLMPFSTLPSPSEAPPQGISFLYLVSMHLFFIPGFSVRPNLFTPPPSLPPSCGFASKAKLPQGSASRTECSLRSR